MRIRIVAALGLLVVGGCSDRALPLKSPESPPTTQSSSPDLAQLTDLSIGESPDAADPPVTDMGRLPERLLGSIAFLGHRHPQTHSEIQAAFYQTPAQANLAGCDLYLPIGDLSFGQCASFHCPVSGTLPSAGSLTFQSGQSGATAMPNPDGSYSFATIFAMPPGDLMRVSGGGSTVPAFPEQNVMMPDNITLTSPSSADAGDLPISTSEDLALAWTSGQAGAKALVFLVTGQATGYDKVVCAFDAGLGQGSIPHTTLAPFAGKHGSMSWGQALESSFTAGSWHISLLAISDDYHTVTFQ
jgi:hypothetical protein